MRYRENLEPSVHNLSFEVKAGMKVGIVGRTGAGKSSILQTLFRLIDRYEGTITIDDKDIRDVGLHLLRKNIAYIPQTPFIMQGTIRENLDPFHRFEDAQICAMLESVRLHEYIPRLSEEVTDGNQMFSMGQK